MEKLRPKEVRILPPLFLQIKCPNIFYSVTHISQIVNVYRFINESLTSLTDLQPSTSYSQVSSPTANSSHRLKTGGSWTSTVRFNPISFPSYGETRPLVLVGALEIRSGRPEVRRVERPVNYTDLPKDERCLRNVYNGQSTQESGPILSSVEEHGGGFSLRKVCPSHLLTFGLVSTF